MTKRFTLAYEKGNWWAVRDGDITLWKEEVIHLLNELATKCSQLKKENEQLKSEIEKLSYSNEDLLSEKRNWQRMSDEYTKLSDENEQLRNKKERYKRLSEIRQQQINNRILTIKEFINNCSDNKVRSVLEELFYSEVNEYDLSSENRKLLNENEQLKQEIKEQKIQLNFITDQKNDFHRKLLERNHSIGLWKRENGQLKKDVEYWKQVASQYSNELNVFEHCKKYKTECKDIYWSSD